MENNKEWREDFDKEFITSDDKGAVVYEEYNGVGIYTGEEFKDFIQQQLDKQKKEYEQALKDERHLLEASVNKVKELEKELKIADDRWKSNEKYRDDYLDLKAGYEPEIAFELKKQKEEIIEMIKAKQNLIKSGGEFDDGVEAGYRYIINNIK